MTDQELDTLMRRVLLDSLNWAGLYSDLDGKTNAWHLREIVRRLCEQRQKISTSADEQQDHAAQRGRDASEQRRA